MRGGYAQPLCACQPLAKSAHGRVAQLYERKGLAAILVCTQRTQRRNQRKGHRCSYKAAPHQQKRRTGLALRASG